MENGWVNKLKEMRGEPSNIVVGDSYSANKM